MASDRTTGTLWHGSERHTRDEIRRRQLMDAALELYGTIGYRATTVQAVCKLAAVSSRSFYELYPHQEALLAQLYRSLNEEVLSGISGAHIDAEDGLAASVRGLVARSLRPVLADERKARVLEVESVGVSADLERHRRAAYRTFAVAIDDAFAALLRAGLTSETPGGVTSLILVGGITEALMQRVQTPVPEREECTSFIDQVSAVIVRLLV